MCSCKQHLKYPFFFVCEWARLLFEEINQRGKRWYIYVEEWDIHVGVNGSEYRCWKVMSAIGDEELKRSWHEVLLSRVCSIGDIQARKSEGQNARYLFYSRISFFYLRICSMHVSDRTHDEITDKTSHEEHRRACVLWFGFAKQGRIMLLFHVTRKSVQRLLQAVLLNRTPTTSNKNTIIPGTYFMYIEDTMLRPI